MEEVKDEHPLTRRFLRAVYEGNRAEVSQLIEQGVVIDSTHQTGLQAIHFAAKSGDVEMCSELLRKGASVNAVTQKGSSPLHIASLLGQTDVVKLLLKSGAEVNKLASYNNEMFTALYMASQIGHQEIVTLLLAYGADPSLQTTNGCTAKYVATQQGFPLIAQILEEYESKYKQPQAAAEEQNDSSSHRKSNLNGDVSKEMQESIEKLKLNGDSEHPNHANGFSENALEKSLAVDGGTNGAKMAAERCDRRFESGREIVLNKLKANLPPMYLEAIPSPVQSPRRGARKAMDKNSPKD